MSIFYVHNIVQLVLSFQTPLISLIIIIYIYLKKSKNKPTSKYLSNSICKWLFVKMSNLPHTYD
jgi:hypothetical protein